MINNKSKNKYNQTINNKLNNYKIKIIIIKIKQMIWLNKTICKKQIFNYKKVIQKVINKQFNNNKNVLEIQKCNQFNYKIKLSNYKANKRFNSKLKK